MEQSTNTSSQGETAALFEDVFRRADKNDDGKLSKEEFYSYFKDDILNSEDLESLFKEVDTDKSGNIILSELCNYFKQGFDPYSNLFRSLEGVHGSLSTSLLTTASNYQNEDYFGQFKIRFFLREFQNNLLSLMKPVEAAVESLERQTITQFNRQKRFETHEVGEMNYSPAQTTGDISEDVRGLRQQINRLTSIVDQLQAKPIQLSFLPDVIEKNESETDSIYLIVHRRMNANPSDVPDFQNTLRNYARATRKEKGCHHIYVKESKDGLLYDLYEIWQTEAAYEAHVRGVNYREHVKSNIDFLTKPEEVSKLQVPSSWVPNNVDDLEDD